MAATLAAVVIILACAGAGAWLALRLSRRAGFTLPRDLPPRKRRMLVLMVVGALAINLAIAISFASGNPGVGIGIVVAFYVLPTFITTPLRIRRSRREAEDARAVRAQRNRATR